MRIMFVSKKTEDREKVSNDEYHARELAQRVEDQRRADIDDEKGLWSAILSTRIEQEKSMAFAVMEADEALEEYRKRFS